MNYLLLPDFRSVLAVSREWKNVASSDEVWQVFYYHKFLRFNPGTDLAIRTGYMRNYRLRMADPQKGDRVEVSWMGKFRLESSDVYHGLAWWVAIVVDKHTAHGKYKIHYPGWDPRWDEWVPRNRLRWAVEKNTLESIEVNDTVELWCIGSHVPGAWLESYVRKIRHNRYCLGSVLATGSLWVERDRLRLVRKASVITPNSALSIRDRLFGRRVHENDDEGRSCVTM